MEPALERDGVTIYCCDALEVLKTLPTGLVHCCVTSPPYWGLRDYGVDGQLGLEKTPDEYVEKMVAVFREVRRVLRDDGTLWLNMGDSYSGSGWGGKGNLKGNEHGQQDAVVALRRALCDGLKPKDLVGIPWMLAFALRSDGWWLRQDIIWHKRSPIPESVTDRCTKAHEYIFLMAKSRKHWFDRNAISEPCICGNRGSRFDKGMTAIHQNGRMQHGVRIERADRNRRSVWTLSPEPYPEAHFATFPTKLVEICLLAGTSPACCSECGDCYVKTETGSYEPTCDCEDGDEASCVVLDPFIGSGTTAQVARKLGCRCIGIELNPEYIKLIDKRLRQRMLPL